MIEFCLLRHIFYDSKISCLTFMPKFFGLKKAKNLLPIKQITGYFVDFI